MSGPFHALTIGDAASPAMEPVAACLAGLSVLDVRRAPDIPAAVRLVEEAWHPDLAVVCQHWSDEYTPSDVRRLFSLFPLARLICAYGPWCASDGRSRDIWPLAVRVPVKAAAARIEAELEVLRGVREPLPLTASRDEIYAFDQG
jgi:hypothetical protein